MNYALLVEEEKMYPTNYTVKHDGVKVYGEYNLKGGDLAENQIKQLYYSGFIKVKNVECNHVYELNYISPYNEEILRCKLCDFVKTI